MNPDILLQHVFAQAWQIAVLAIVVAIIVRAVARSRPHVAHALWLIVVIKCVTPPLWSHSCAVFSQVQAILQPSETPVPWYVQPTDSPLPFTAPDVELLPELPVSVDLPAPPLEYNEQFLSASSETTVSVLTAEPPHAEPPHIEETSRSMIALCQILGIGIALNVLLLTTRFTRCLRRIRRNRVTQFDAEITSHVTSLAATLKLKRVPRVIVSDVLFGPAVLGIFRHVIVLPRCLVESRTKTLSPILAHEILHIRRGDLWTGALQAAVQCMWWFHPAVWIVNRLLSREAERCCDEQVIAELGCSPSEYARSLLTVIECKQRLKPVPVFPGMKPVEITSQRMERIMSLKNGSRKRMPLWSFVAVLLFAAVVLPGAIVGQGDSVSPDRFVNRVADEPQFGAPKPEVVRYDIGDLVERMMSERSTTRTVAEHCLFSEANTAADSVYKVSPASVTFEWTDASGLRAFDDSIEKMLATSAEPQRVVLNNLRKQVHAVTATTAENSSMRGELRVGLSNDRQGIQPESLFLQTNNSLLVLHIKDAHNRIAQRMQRFRTHGFAPISINATVISGPAHTIDQLVSAWAAVPRRRSSMTRSNTEAELKQPASRLRTEGPRHQTIQPVDYVTHVVERDEPAQLRILNARETASLIEQARQSPRNNLNLMQVVVYNGQEAKIEDCVLRPFVVGFQDHEPLLRIVPSGLTMTLVPTIVDEGTVCLRCLAELNDITTVDTATLRDVSSGKTLTYQVPDCRTVRVQTTVATRTGQSLLISGLTKTYDDGPDESVAVLLQAERGDEVNSNQTADDRHVLSLPPEAKLHGVGVNSDARVVGEFTNGDAVVSATPRDTPGEPPGDATKQDVGETSPSSLLPGPAGDSEDVETNRITVQQPVVTVIGAVKNPGDYEIPRDRDIRFLDAVNLAGGFVSRVDDRVVLQRPLGSGESAVIVLSIKSAQQDQKQNMRIGPGDKLIVEKLTSPKSRDSDTAGPDWEEHLNKQVSLSFRDVSLSSALKTLAKTHRVNFAIDTGSKRKLRGEADPKVSVVVEDVSLRVALNELCRSQRLKWDLRDAVIEIAPEQPFTPRAYNVADLVVPLAQPGPNQDEVSATKFNAAGSPPPKATRAVAEPLPRPVHRASHAMTEPMQADFAPLVELIKATVEPESWNENGVISPHNNTLSLVIRQTPDVHVQINELLGRLRRQPERMFLSCRVLQFETAEQITWLDQHAALQTTPSGHRWALLSAQRSQFLDDSVAQGHATLLSSTRSNVIAGHTMPVRVTPDKILLPVLQITPTLLPAGDLFRIDYTTNHDLRPFLADLELQPQPSSSAIVGVGQTLLLDLDDPRMRPDAAPEVIGVTQVDREPAKKLTGRIVVAITPQHVLHKR